LTRSSGLPKRPWFKHQIYAPGLYTGYGVKTLPAVREAIEQRDWNQAREQIVLVAETIQGLIGEIDRATEVVKVNLRR
jgi:N-acetylated-alpha-linked acidic dipeptidase